MDFTFFAPTGGQVLTFLYVVVVIAACVVLGWIVLTSPKGGQAVLLDGSATPIGTADAPSFVAPPPQEKRRGSVYDGYPNPKE